MKICSGGCYRGGICIATENRRLWKVDLDLELGRSLFFSAIEPKVGAELQVPEVANARIFTILIKLASESSGEKTMPLPPVDLNLLYLVLSWSVGDLW